SSRSVKRGFTNVNCVPGVRIFSRALERAGHQSQPSGKHREHEDEVKQTCLSEVDLQMCEYAYKDDDGSAAGQHPSRERTPVEEQQPDADHKWNQRESKRVAPKPDPIAARDLHLIH